MNARSILMMAVILLLVPVAWAEAPAPPPACPAQGSGLAGVEAWAAANCNCPETDDCCENPATTCNGDFTIEFLGMAKDGDLIAFEWEVCDIQDQTLPGNERPALSHWIFGLGQILCLAEGVDLAELIVGAYLNDQQLSLEDDVEIGLDPTTQLFGFKFDTGVEGGTCNTFGVIFDTSKLAEGWTLGIGCVLAATKAGNQDIKRAERASPGYACIVGPVCVLDEEDCQTETAWGGNTAGGGAAWWFYYDAADGGVQTIWAGQTIDVGTVEVVDGTVYIVLTGGWTLQDDDEAVKIKGYDVIPDSRPVAGLFTGEGTYKGTDLTVPIGVYPFYAIHLDVELCE